MAPSHQELPPWDPESHFPLPLPQASKEQGLRGSGMAILLYTRPVRLKQEPKSPVSHLHQIDRLRQWVDIVAKSKHHDLHCKAGGRGGAVGLEASRCPLCP